MGKKKSILVDDMEHCLYCGSPYVEIHHVFGGSYRQISDKWGCVVPLCREHHTGGDGVHFNTPLRKQLQELAQNRFEEVYGKDFLEIFGKRFV